MKIKKTYTELIEFASISNNYSYLEKDNENKLVSAINLINKQLKGIFEEYNDERDTIQINMCLVDDITQAILYDVIPGTNGQPATREKRYSVSGMIKLKDAIKKLNKKQVQIHSRIVEGIEDLISTLTDDERIAFSELIIPEQKEL